MAVPGLTGRAWLGHGGVDLFVVSVFSVPSSAKQMNELLTQPSSALIKSKKFIGHIKQHFISPPTYVTNGIQYFVKCCITIWLQLNFQPDNMLFGGLRPLLPTCSLRSCSCLDSVSTRRLVLSSCCCRLRNSFCSVSPSSAVSDIARIRGNQSRIFSYNNNYLPVSMALLTMTETNS